MSGGVGGGVVESSSQGHNLRIQQPTVKNDYDNVHLRVDWTNLQLTSPLAKLMEAHQTNCSLPLGELIMRNTCGLGSDLHMWTQGLLNGMDKGLRVHTRGPWIFRDAEACHDTITTTTTLTSKVDMMSTMLCYFPFAEKRCPNDNEYLQSIEPNQILPKLHNGKGHALRVESMDFRERLALSFSEIRASGIEYLFSQTSPIVVQEAKRQIVQVFGGPPPPSNQLITVHIRWGDKIHETTLQPMDGYISAVQRLADSKKLVGSDVHIFLASEDPSAVQMFQQEAKVRQWNVYVDYYYQEFQTSRNGELNGNPIMSKQLQGRPGFVALASVLVAMQANDYVLTTRSNWSRLFNELRKNVIDPRCNNCTRMVDLTPIPFEW